MAGALSTTQSIKGILSAEQGIAGILSTPQSLNAVLSVPDEELVPLYTGAYEVTPSESAQTLGTDGKKMTDDVTVNPIPSQYIVPSGSIAIVSDDTYDVTEYASAVVNVGSPPLQTVSKSYTPSESAQSEQITPSSGYYGLGEVDISVGAVSSTYVGSGITRRDGDDLTASGDTVNVPAGYYENAASKAVASGKVIPASSITADSATVSVGADYIALNRKCTNTPTVSPAGYLSTGTSGKTDITLKASMAIDPTPTASGATVTIPSGYYTASTTKSVASGTEGTPTATKGTVSSHSISVTPSVTNVAGYITGGTKTGTAVSVSASELVSGTKSITSNGTNIDVKNYAAVDVAVPSGTPTLQTVSKTYTPTESQQTESVTASSGYDGLEEVDVTVNAISSTYVGSGITRRDSTNMSASGRTVSAPAGYYASNASYQMTESQAVLTSSVDSTGLITSTLTTTSAGYRAAGTQTHTQQLTTQAAQTLHPSTTDQTIAKEKFLTGVQTFKAVTTSNLTADNIKSGVIVKIGDSTDDDCVASVTGTYSGGGSSKNVQIKQSTSRTNSGSLTKVNGDLTVSKTGTYDIYWSGGRSNTSTSYTWGTKLYIDGSGYGTENTTWTNNCQSNHLSNVSLTANQKLSVYARGRSGSYYTFVPMLVIIEV